VDGAAPGDAAAVRTRAPDLAQPGVDSAAQGVYLRDLEREAAVSAVFDAQHDQLVRLARLLGADADAEDVVAEAFYELYRRWDRLRDPSSAAAYVRSAVCNLARMRLRHLQVVRRHASLPSPDPDSVGSAESQVLLQEEHQEVIDALATLPARQRQALVLRYWLDLREAEVAAAMGISKGAVKAHTSRGMAALTRRLGEAR
jgi:RNA polymerase sigma-70 factor (sigma-E family)